VISVAFFGGYGAGVIDFLWATIYLVLGGVLSWKTWYKSLYFSLKGGGTTWRWFLFITSYFVHTVFVSIAAIGFSNFATSGLLFMLKVFDGNMAIGCLALVGFLLWTLTAASSILLLKKSWCLFRSSGVESQAKRNAFTMLANQVN